MAKKKPPDHPKPTKTLRERAEEKLRTTQKDVAKMTTADVQRLVHELQVHQIELELQNQELRETQVELARTRDRYSDLYEFAPVGYLSLDDKSVIHEANLTAANLLARERPSLIGHHLSDFVARESQNALYLRWHEALESIIRTQCEVRITRLDGSAFDAQLDIVVCGTNPGNSGVSQIEEVRVTLSDISQRKAAEAELQRLNETLEQRVAERTSEVQLLAEAISHLGEGVLITEDELEWPGPKVVFVNEAMCRITGYSAEELIGETPRILQGERTNRGTMDWLKSELAAGRSCMIEAINYRKDGTSYDVELLVTPLINEEGQRTNFVAIHRDISERKRMEEALRESEKRFRQAVDLYPGIFVIYDPQRRYQFVNRRGLEMMERPLGQLIGKRDEDLWPHELYNTYLPLLEQALAIKSHQTAELTFPSPTEDLTIVVHYVPRVNDRGEILEVIAVTEDVTERKKTEESLRRTLEFNESLVNTAQTIVLVIDTEGRIVQFNPYLEELTGWRLEELRGKDWFETLLPGCDREETRRLFGQALSGKRTRGNVNPIITKEGQHRDIEWYDAPLHSAQGELIGLLCTGQDITERRKAEEGLRRREREFHTLADNVPALFAYVEKDLRYQFVNKRYEDFFNRPADQIVGQPVKDILGEPAWENVRPLLESALGGETVKWEVELPLPGGQRKWFSASYVPNYEGEQVVGIFVLTFDITRRKQAEHALRESEEQTKAILAALPAHIAVINYEGEIVTVNPAWENFAFENEGIPALCNVGANYLEVCRSATGLDAVSGAQVAAGLQAILDGLSNEFSMEYPCHSATQQRWFLLQATPFCNEKYGAVISHTNITDRVKAEQLLRESEERIRAILNTAADAIITIDQKGIITGVNLATERMFGYAKTELIGQNVKTLMPPPYFEAHDSFIARYLETGEARIIGIGREVQACRKDGTVFPVALAVRQIEPLRLFTGIIRDISQRHYLQKQILEIAAEEQRRIGHDLHDDEGQELTGLALSMDTLVTLLKRESRPEVAIARHLLDDLKRTMQKVRWLSRGLNPVEVDPEGLMAALESLAKRTSDLHSINCVFTCTKPVHFSSTNTATHLYRIAQEATNNAIRHGQAHNIQILLEEKDKLITLQIKDDGIGIDLANADQTEGLGLRIMRYRADLIHAKFTIEPLPKSGTLVSCTFN